MSTRSSVTESVVRNHLQAFVVKGGKIVSQTFAMYAVNAGDARAA